MMNMNLMKDIILLFFHIFISFLNNSVFNPVCFFSLRLYAGPTQNETSQFLYPEIDKRKNIENKEVL